MSTSPPSPIKKAVAYYRVSSERQLKDRPDQDTTPPDIKEKTGLGLEAQQVAVRVFAEREGYTITDHYTEVESGKKDQRPRLAEAIALCKKNKATLIIAKLDRLSRRVSFISSLMDSKVDFRAVDNPHANKMMVQMLAVFAEHEREQISTRTIEALRAAKQRGTVLGKHGREVLSRQNAATAAQFAEALRPTIEQLQAKGFKTVRALKCELNRLEVPTYRPGKNWHRSSVHNILKRLTTFIDN